MPQKKIKSFRKQSCLMFRRVKRHFDLKKLTIGEHIVSLYSSETKSRGSFFDRVSEWSRNNKKNL